MFFENVLYRPLGFHLLAWQKAFLRELYGTHERDSWLRQFWEAFLLVSKKNGKSFLVSGLPLYHIVREDVYNPLVYGCATAREQAGEVFDRSAKMVEASEPLSARLKITESTKRIFRKDGNGLYRVVSAEGKFQDGKEPSMAILDEIHRYTTPASETMLDVMEKGCLAREESLILKLTTAHAEHESKLAVEQYERADQVRTGKLKMPRMLVKIFQADPERIKADPGFWKTREARVQANPSHEDNGGFVRDEKIVIERDKGLQNPAGKAKYLRYHLGIPITSERQKAIRPEDWAACGVKGIRATMGRPCYAGVDLAATTDLAAVSLIFPHDEDDSVDALSVCWIPKDRVIAIGETTRKPMESWVAQGILRTSPGAEIKQSLIVEYLQWCSETFNLVQVGYDPWNAGSLKEEGEKIGLTMVEVPQTLRSLAEPVKKFQALVATHSFRHENTELLNWCADCLDLRSDGNDNYRPSKPDRQKEKARIDPIAADITAMHCWLRDTAQEVGYNTVADVVL